MRGLRASLTAAVLVAVAASPGWAFKKCRMPDGKLLFTDVPPAGCVVQGELTNAPEAPDVPDAGASGAAAHTEGEAAAPEAKPSETADDARAISARRRIERQLKQAAEDLAGIRREFASAPKVPGGIWVDTTSGEGTYYGKERVRDDIDADLRAREKKALMRIQTLRDEFAALTLEIEKSHGGRAPSWWEPVRCDGCP